MKRTAQLIIVAFLFMGCSDGFLLGGPENGSTPAQCAANTTQACGCPVGGLGTQTCNAAGNAWGPCLGCPKPTPGSDAGVGSDSTVPPPVGDSGVVTPKTDSKVTPPPNKDGGGPPPKTDAFVPTGPTKYVAPNGNDSNPGTKSSPWRTLKKAGNSAVAGDTIYVRAGTYNERLEPKNSGSAGKFITFSAYPGEKPIIEGKTFNIPAGEGIVQVYGVDYIRIRGFKVQHAKPDINSNGIMVEQAKHIYIEKNHTYDTMSSGIGVWASEDVTIDGNEVEKALNHGEQECISVASTKGFEIKNNHVHHNGGDNNTDGGEGICPKDGSSNGKVHHNRVHDIKWERPGIYLDAWNQHTFNIEIYQNIVYNCSGAGFALGAEQGGVLENITLHNNLSYSNGLSGFEFGAWGGSQSSNRPVRNVKIINNTAYNNGLTWGGGLMIENGDAKQIVVRNNIFSQNKFFQISNDAGLSSSNFLVDHNLIDGHRGASGEVWGSNPIKASPNFVNAGAADFRLKSGSPAIDKGSASGAPKFDYNGATRPKGSGFDVGATEF